MKNIYSSAAVLITEDGKYFFRIRKLTPLNIIIDDLMLISEQQVPVINQKPIKRYYVNAKEIDEIFSIFSKVINSK